ncbi:MAG: MFS transporter [Phenylobacterium sp.]|nr:MAG: MFS transporter [Phenylobacterium sp.]
MQTRPATAREAGRKLPIYPLLVLMLVNVFILMDRQVLSVLAEAIKADLKISDSQMGFMFGTSLSVFYAIFSIPLGRIADVWTRKNLMAWSVAAWSVMIVLTGCARNFLSFATFRAGVGVGEAGASPAAMSLISDYFPPRMRSTALSVFSSGVPIGQGLGLFLGGFILESWNLAFRDAAHAPFGLLGWQAAIICIALPGPLLALWLHSLKEPVRGESEGLAMPSHPHPFGEAWTEMQAVLPVFSLFLMRRLGGSWKVIGWNLAIGAAIGLGITGLIAATGSGAQWLALGLGFYCVACWSQTLALRDPAAFAMIFRCPALMFTNVGLAAYIFVMFGVAAWIVPYLIRTYHISPAEAGLVMGLITSVMGFLGNMLGGATADFLQRYTPRARLYVLLGSLALTVPSVILMLVVDQKMQAYICIALFYLTSTAWYGVGPSIINGLVLPRMRGAASAFFLIVITLLGMALGPYTMGYISDHFLAGGASPADSLRLGILWGLPMLIVAAAFLIAATFHLARDDASRLARARALGEPV